MHSEPWLAGSVGRHVSACGVCSQGCQIVGCSAYLRSATLDLECSGGEHGRGIMFGMENLKRVLSGSGFSPSE